MKVIREASYLEKFNNYNVMDCANFGTCCLSGLCCNGGGGVMM